MGVLRGLGKDVGFGFDTLGVVPVDDAQDTATLLGRGDDHQGHRP